MPRKDFSPLARPLLYFAGNPGHARGPQLKAPQLVAPTPLAKADHFRAARPLFLMNSNLHAWHFTRPGWTNAVQPNLFWCYFISEEIARLKPESRFGEPADVSLMIRAIAPGGRL
jgi:hypothetical protein